jgi:putative spermidine/putrescine transport system ATP-binding protein
VAPPGAAGEPLSRAAVADAATVDSPGDHLVIERLEKRYGATVAVAGLDLAVRQGELIALLGPSGCGKSTTLRMVAGLAVATGGRIAIAGRDVTHLPAYRRDIGLVFQNYALFPHMTVAANVAFGLEMRKLPKAETAQRVAEALAMVRLGELGARRPRELSGGQQQRVALARALAIRPSILLLDEPLSNLDAKLREEMRNEIRDIQRRLGITTLFVTHDQVEALSMCDRVAVMRAGELIQVGTPLEIYERPRDPFIADFVGRTNKLAGIVQDDGAVAVGPLLLRVGATPPRGTKVLVLVRPHRIRLAPAADAGRIDHQTNRVAGRIVRTTYVGDLFQHDVDIGAGIIQVEQPSASGPQPLGVGAAVELSWWALDSLVFEAPP